MQLETIVSGPVAVPGAFKLEEGRRGRYDSLTAWRGVACLSVIVYHSIFTGFGRSPAGRNFFFDLLHLTWLGVPIFFVISGYCITASADALRRRETPARHFFWRRFYRIYPPYWAWLGLLALIGYLVERAAPGFFRGALIAVPQDLTKWQWFGNLTLTETWRSHFTPGAGNGLWGPVWTLCYEEQFYLAVGLILLFARRFLFSSVLLITVVVLVGNFLIPGYAKNVQGTFLDVHWLTFASGILVYYALNYAPAERRGWICLPLVAGMVAAITDPRQTTYLDGKWLFVFSGVVACYLYKYLGPRWRAWFWIPLLFGIVGVLADRQWLQPKTAEEANESCLAAFAFSLLIVGLAQRDGALSSSRILRPLMFCGTMCYSLYLVHWPTVTLLGHLFDQMGVTHPAAILLITVPVCVATSILIGRGFHLLIERRFWNPQLDDSASRQASIDGASAAAKAAFR